MNENFEKKKDWILNQLHSYSVLTWKDTLLFHVMNRYKYRFGINRENLHQPYWFLYIHRHIHTHSCNEMCPVHLTNLWGVLSSSTALGLKEAQSFYL